MFRIMSIATLIMIAVCFFIGAALALADEAPLEVVPATGAKQSIDTALSASTEVDCILAANDRDGDAYDFADYFQAPTTASTIPPVDAEKIEEPELDRMTTIEI